MRRFRLPLAVVSSVALAIIVCATDRNEISAESPSPLEIALAENGDEPAASKDAQSKWGDLSGTFVLDGDVQAQPPISPNKDEAYCSKSPLLDEALLVNKSSNGVANIVVRLETKTGQKIAVHESYAKTADSRITLDNKSCRFAPHVCLLRTTQTLVITNSDDVSHNTAAYLDRNDPFNEVTAVKQSIERRIARPERTPSKINCSIHPWMSGWLVVSDHPYAAATDENGKFRIANLPAGKHTFQIWQEKAGWVHNVTQNGKLVEWKRGRVTLKIHPGANELGEIRLKPGMFAGEDARGTQ